MNRPCDKAIICDSPLEPGSLGSSYLPVPATSAARCRGLNCVGDDYPGNLSSECADADYLADAFTCTCEGGVVDKMLRAPGFGPFEWQAQNLPPGLTFVRASSSCDGVLRLYGVTTSPGRFFTKITAKDGFGNSTSATLQFNVLAILTPSLPVPVVGTPYSFQLQAAGGSGHYAWKIVAGALAPGLRMDSAGLITGTPLSAPPASVQFRVIDTECEKPDISYYQPYIDILGDSTTVTATILGFPEFSASPTKAYKTVAWTGLAKNATVYPGAMAPLSFSMTMLYCGATSIDAAGNAVAARNEQGYRSANSGYFLTLDGPCMYGDVIAQAVLLGTFSVDPATFAGGPSGPARDMTWGLTAEQGYSSVDSPTQARTSRMGMSGRTLYQIDRTVTLSDEYTDADAAGGAKTQLGTGLVAANFPRGSGWKSQTTAVNYTLGCHNLMVGQSYKVTAYFLNSSGGVTASETTFTAASADHDVTGAMAVPAAGTWTALISASIAFA